MAPVERRDPGRRTAFILAVTVHVLLAAFLFFGVRWSSEHPQPMVAELWSEIPTVQPPPRAVKPEPPPEPKPEPKPEPEPEPKPQPKPEPKVEPKPQPKVDIALEKEKERKKQEAQQRAEEEKREKERQAKEEAERKQEAERKKEEARKKAEAEKERAERIRREAEAQRKYMLAQLGEAVPDQPPSKGPLVGEQPLTGDPHARAGYVDKIRAKIRSNIVLPPNMSGNPEAQYEVQQLPTGEVVGVRLRKSSGVKSYDEAVERAIWKSSPLPKPERGDLFERMLHLKFRPVE